MKHKSILKHLLSICLCTALVLLCLFSTAVNADAATIVERGTCGDNLTWTLDSDGILTISGTGAMKDYYPSSSVPWYSSSSSVKKVVLKDGVTSIGASAFYNCYSLTSVTIGNRVTSIGDYAFQSCTSLTSVTIGNRVTSIGSYAFDDCTSLTSVTIPDSVTSIGIGAFGGCSSLESMTIPFVGGSRKTATDTYQYPFGYFFGTYSYTGGTATKQYYYGSSTSSTDYSTYYIPSSLKTVTVTGGEILYGAFYNCSSLTSVTIGDSVTSIGNYAFYNCDSLTGVYISDIAAWCNISFGNSSANPLYYASTLYLNGEIVTDLVIPDSVTSIGDRAFYYCSSLTSVTIGDSVTTIGDAAFYYCTSLTSMTIGDSVTSIGDYAFDGCSSLTSVDIPDSVTSICKQAFNNCTSLTSVTIPDSVTTIGDYTFSGCSSLTSVTIGDSVTSIGDYAFRNCSSLTGVYISDIAAWCNISFGNAYANPLYYAKTLYLNGEIVTDLVIPDGVTSIKFGAFFGCSSLTSVTIGDSVTSIGYDAFSYCTSLTSVTIGDSVTSIRGGAFSYCTSLTSVTIGDSVTSIGESAFYNCSSLTGVYISDIAAWCNISFGNSSANPLYYAKTLYLNGEIVTDLVIPDSVTSIGGYAFYNCTSLTSVDIPNSVTSIGSNAFSGCTSLTGVYISDIAAWCNISFDGNAYANPLYYAKTLYLNGERVTDLVIPDGVTSIKFGAFFGCSSLTSVTIPDSVTSIGDFAFSGCSSLESMTIPFVGGSRKTAAHIDQYPFGYIFGTSSYTGGTATKQYYHGSGTSSTTYNTYYIPSSLKTVTVTGGEILYGAFYNCSKLTSVTIGDSVTSIGSGAFYNCSKLTSVTIGDSVTSIGSGAFYGCSSLEAITIPFVGDSRKTAADRYKYPFGYIFGTSSYTGGTATEQYYYDYDTITYSTYYIPSSLKTVTFTGGEILYGAFVNCSSLTSVTIGDSVTSIGRGAFYGCSSLESITIPFVGGSRKTAADTYQYPFGYIFGSDSYTGGAATKQYYYDWSILSTTSRTYYIPSSLKTVTVTGGEILYGAFYNCSSLTSVDIPDSVTSIGSSAFYNCSSLTSVTIGDSVTSIGSSAFEDCTSLTSVTIPDSVTSIGAGAFRVCTSLTGIWVDENNQYYCSDDQGVLFDKNKNVLIQAPGGISGAYTIPDSVISIGRSAFYNCTNMNSINFLGNAPTIHSSGFYNVTATAYYPVGDETWTEDVLQSYDGNITWIAYNPLKITTQPKTAYAIIGDTVKTTVQASGDGLTYQWYIKNAGASSYTKSSIKTATYSCKMSDTTNGRYVRCKITDQYGNSVWTNTVRLKSKALAITTQPVSKTVKDGATAKFSVTPNGTNVTYQWQYRTSSSGSWKNASATGNKTKTLSVAATVAKHGYQYRCKVTDTAGNTVYTSVVTLNVLGIKTQPVSKTVKAGATAKFTVTATGKGLTYQWQYRTSSSGSWKNVSAASGKTANYSLTTAVKHHGYQYRCKITDAAGNKVYTKTVTLYVLGIKTQPASKTVKVGATAKFTVAATGKGLTYQWQYRTSSSGSWKNVSVASGKTANYSLTAAARHNGYQYRCKITDSAGNVIYTSIVKLTVK